ncbi:MAG: RHS repeat-associated core domain-containing protein [Thermoanaerobaculia bacterium]
MGGPQLDQLDYDDGGRLIRWTNKDASLFYTDFNLDGKPGKTIATHFRNASGLTPSPDIVGAFIQEHQWNEHGERVEWTMPRTATFTTPLPWTDRLRATFDAMGNMTVLDRNLFGGTAFASVLTAEYRNAGRPNARTLTTSCGSTSCTPASVRRQYNYDATTGSLNEFTVTVGSLLVAGSRITAFDGLQIRDAQLLGISNGTRVSHWSYDARSRLTIATIGRNVTQSLTPADFRTELTRTPRFDAPSHAALTGRGIDVVRLDPPSQSATEAAAHKIASVTDGASIRTYTYNGSERKDDGTFEYEWDEKGRLVRATEKVSVPAQLAIMRVTYAHDGNDRMIGRRVEAAQTSATPLDWQLASPAILTDGIPADATFVWDPITDRIAAIFDSTTGALVRQVLHGDLAYDDPVEVTLLEPADPTKINRLYPVYDEATAGHLEAVLNVNGEVVSRRVVADAYGDDAFSIAGAVIDRIALRAKKGADGTLSSMEVTVRASEQLQSTSVPAGIRLAALDADAKVLRTASVPASLADGSTARVTLTNAEWTTLLADASSLSLAATDALRAEAWSSALPVLPTPEWARATKPVFSSPEMPVEVRESLASVDTWLATTSADGEATTTLYEVSDVAIAGSDAVTDDPARFLVSSSFHALPFVDGVTRHSLARARWLDHHTGTFLTTDPLGYADSPNLYAFAGGDPVNGRDPTGERLKLNGPNPGADYLLIRAALQNPAAAEQLRLQGDASGVWVEFRTTKEAFVRTAVEDPADFERYLRINGIPPLHDSRPVESRFADIVASDKVVEFRTGSLAKRYTSLGLETKRVGMEWGGGVTIEPYESLSGNVEIVVDPGHLGVGQMVLEQKMGLDLDVSITIMHEFGHALAYVLDRPEYFLVYSVEIENQMRARRGQHRFRKYEDPKHPGPLEPAPRPIIDVRPHTETREESEKRDRDRIEALRRNVWKGMGPK